MTSTWGSGHTGIPKAPPIAEPGPEMTVTQLERVDLDRETIITNTTSRIPDQAGPKTAPDGSHFAAIVD